MSAAAAYVWLNGLMRDDEKMSCADERRAIAAALRAKRLYPGAVGEVLSAVLLDRAAFGFRFGPGLGLELMQELESQDPPRFGVTSDDPAALALAGMEYARRRYGQPF